MPEDQKKLALLKKGMFMNYQHHWIVDNMPVTWCYPVENGQHYCSTGGFLTPAPTISDPDLLPRRLPDGLLRG